MTGIQVFNGKGVFISRAWRNTKRWKSYGMAEDEDQCLWFIDCGPEDTVIKKIDLLNGNRVLVKIFLADIIGEVYSESKCRFLTLAGGKLFITDLGLDQVFVMSTSGDIGSVRRFGCSGDGDGMFSDPAGVVVDDVGNILVADSKNHRLCLFDKKRNWIKKFQVSQISLLAMCFIINIAGSCETSQRHPAGQQQGRAVLSQHAGQGGCRQVRPHMT